MSFEYALISAMGEWGLHINSINLEEGIYHRFKSLGTCKNKCCEYRIFENQLGAHFQCWRRGISRFWFADRDSPFTARQIRQMQEERERVAAQWRVKKAYQREHAIKRALNFWQGHPSTADTTEHPYILRKQIKPYFARRVMKDRWIKELLLVPIRDIHYQFQGLQIINANGRFKRPWKGTTYKENMIWLCLPLPDDYAGVIRICEGYATGCTILQITRSPVICALSAGNMPIVAALLRQKCPDAILKICADDDQWNKENAGLLAAAKAQALSGATVYIPDFAGMDIAGAPTDFNDLYCLAGAVAVRRDLILIRG